MKQAWNKFIKLHFERHIFIYQALFLMTALYLMIPASRPQIMPLYYIILGIFINKARGSEKEPANDKPPQE